MEKKHSTAEQIALALSAGVAVPEAAQFPPHSRHIPWAAFWYWPPFTPRNVPDRQERRAMKTIRSPSSKLSGWCLVVLEEPSRTRSNTPNTLDGPTASRLTSDRGSSPMQTAYRWFERCSSPMSAKCSIDWCGMSACSDNVRLARATLVIDSFFRLAASIDGRHGRRGLSSRRRLWRTDLFSTGGVPTGANAAPGHATGILSLHQKQTHAQETTYLWFLNTRWQRTRDAARTNRHRPAISGKSSSRNPQLPETAGWIDRPQSTRGPRWFVWYTRK